MATLTATDTLQQYLAGKGIRSFPAAGHEVTAHCFWAPCTGKTHKGKGKLYLNTETWLFDCKVCGTQGGRRMLLEHFGDTDDQAYLPGANPVTKLQLLSDYADFTAKLLSDNEKIMLYLLRRGLDAETIVDARLGYVPKNFGVCTSLADAHSYSRKDFETSGMLARGAEFHSGRITIPYIQRDKVLQIRGKDPVGKYFTPAGDSVRLYNADRLHEAETVLIVEGEFDTLVAQQTLDFGGQSVAVVGLPGAGSWPGGKEFFPTYFRNAKRVYLGLDPDETGDREMHKLREALGTKARLVTLPRDESVVDPDGKSVKCDWTEYLRPADDYHPWGGHGATDIGELLHTAEMAGKKVFGLADVGRSWRKEKEDQVGLELGWPAIDGLLAPRWLKPGNVCIPLARTGTGKTMFLANIDHRLRRKRVLHITLENTREELFEVLWRIHHFWNPLAEDFDVANEMPHLRIADENRLNMDDVANLIDEYEEDLGAPPDAVQLDYLGYFARSHPGGSEYEKVTAAVTNIKALAKWRRVPIITPHQANRKAQEGHTFEGNEARDGGTIEETADFLFGLYRPAEAVQRANAMTPGCVSPEFNVQFIKSRRGGKGRVAQLVASPASLVLVDRTEAKAYHRVHQEVEQYNQGFSYEDIAGNARQVALKTAQGALL